MMKKRGDTKHGDPLEVLRNMPLHDRMDAVANDVKAKQDRFARIPPHDLAEILEVPQPNQPTNDWQFICYAEKQTLEQFAATMDADELFDLLESDVEAERLKVLRCKFEQFGAGTLKTFRFLKLDEREILESALNRRRLESYRDNGISCISTYTISRDDVTLSFQGDIEDDGHCITLRTPYNDRDGKFKDLTNCLTESW